VSPYLFYLRVLLELFGEVPDLPDADVKLDKMKRPAACADARVSLGSCP
jgi:hypothetical protein